MITEFNFCLECGLKKDLADLPKLKNISHLMFFISADEYVLSNIEDRVLFDVGRIFSTGNEHGGRKIKAVDMISTLKVIFYIMQFVDVEKQKNKGFKSFILSTKETSTLLEELVQSMINCDLNLFEDASLGKCELKTFLDITKVWSIGNDYDNQICEETVLHHYLLARNSKLSSLLMNFGCVPNMRRFILRFDNETVAYMAHHGFLNQDLLENQFVFHEISFGYTCESNNYDRLENIFNSIISCIDPENLSKLFLLKSPKNKNLDAVEYACFNQADRILELILNVDKCFKTIDNAINYNVSNLIPDTIIRNESNRKNDIADSTMESRQRHGNLSQVSCLERIIASSEVDERKASKMLIIKPLAYLIEEYLLISKFVGFIMFFVQTAFMIAFTWHNVNSLTYKFSALLNDTFTSGTNQVDLNFPGALSIMWITWPLLSFSFAVYQVVAITKVLSICEIKSSYVKILCRLPLLDLMILISVILWTIIVISQKLSKSYFQLTAVIFIVGWMRSALFISFCSHWHGFVVSLQSSLSKYFISFLFVFAFIYLGFSFALRLLLAEYASAEKPLYIVAFKTLAALFGMGNLDEIPDEIEDPSKTKLFLKAVIISYCSLVAILVLAIIRQPDTELVVRVGSELFPRLKLRLLKNVVWLMNWRKNSNTALNGEANFGSMLYEMRELFDLGGKTLKIVNGNYILRYYREKIENLEELSKSESDFNKAILKEIRKIHGLLDDIHKNLGLCSN